MRPLFGEECSYGTRENLALIVDVFEDVFWPLHQVTDLVARRRPVNTPNHLLFHLLTQHILNTQHQRRQREFKVRVGGRSAEGGEVWGALPLPRNFLFCDLGTAYFGEFWGAKFIICKGIGDIPMTFPQPKYWGCVPGIPGGVDASAQHSSVADPVVQLGEILTSRKISARINAIKHIKLSITRQTVRSTKLTQCTKELLKIMTNYSSEKQLKQFKSTAG